MKGRSVFLSLPLLVALISMGCASGISGYTTFGGGGTGGGGTGGGSGSALNSTSYVDGVSGADKNDCNSPQSACKTIGHAIALTAPEGSIMVAAGTYNESLTITFSLAIIGSGARTTIIDGGSPNGGPNTVITITNNSTQLTLSGLTVQNGSAYGGGGGISNYGVLTISNSTIQGNTAKPSINGSAVGAGINNSGTLVINDSTISGNTARGGTGECEKQCTGSAQGAGIFDQGILTINNSTLSGNNAISGRLPSSGGAIGGSGSVSINSSTLASNSASSAGGIIGTAVALQNSVVANNSGGDCSGTPSSQGYNLSSDDTCNFDGPGDMNNTDPLLGPLQNNGGPTQTMALLIGSPAIAAGNPNGCTDGQAHLLTTDQRGEPRPENGCDIGAYQLQGDSLWRQCHGVEYSPSKTAAIRRDPRRVSSLTRIAHDHFGSTSRPQRPSLATLMQAALSPKFSQVQHHVGTGDLPHTIFQIAHIACPIFKPVGFHSNRIYDRMPALCQRHECMLGRFHVRRV